MALFPSAPGGGQEVGYGWKGKGITTHVLIEGHGAPVAVSVTSAGGNERAEVPELLKKVSRWLPCKTRWPILEADKGYDSMPLRIELIKMGIFPWIAWRNFKRRKTNFSEASVYKRIRWKVERAHAWLKRSFRRLIVRWERKPQIWQAFLNMALIMMWVEILLR
jgi:IS5 family transposase